MIFSEIRHRPAGRSRVHRHHRRHPVYRKQLPGIRRRLHHERRILLRCGWTVVWSGVRYGLDDRLLYDRHQRKRAKVRQRKRPLREEALARHQDVPQQDDVSGERQFERLDVDVDLVVRTVQLLQVVHVHRVLQSDERQPG